MNLKKVFSWVLSAALIAGTTSVSFAEGGQPTAFGITSANIQNGVLYVNFSANVKADTVTGSNFEIKTSEDVILNNIPWQVDGTGVSAVLPSNMLGENFFMTVKDGVTDENNTVIDGIYRGKFSYNGFIDDLNDNNADGRYQYVINPTVGSVAMSGGVMELPTLKNTGPADNATTMIYRSDWENYKFLNSLLEYDISYNNNTTDNKDDFITILRVSEQPVPFGSNAKIIGYEAAYSWGIMQHGNLTADRYLPTSTSRLWGIGRDPGRVPNTQTLDYNLVKFTDGSKCRLRYITNGNVISIYKALYTGDVLGEYKKLIDIEEDTTLVNEIGVIPQKAGCFSFGTARQNRFAIDNISYLENKSIELLKDSDRVASLSNHINEISQEVATIEGTEGLNNCKADIEEVKAQLTALQEEFDVDVTELQQQCDELLAEVEFKRASDSVASLSNQLNELSQKKDTIVGTEGWNDFKADAEAVKAQLTAIQSEFEIDVTELLQQCDELLDAQAVCDSISYDAYAKLRAKYERGEQIVISQLGSSLTETTPDGTKRIARAIADEIGIPSDTEIPMYTPDTLNVGGYLSLDEWIEASIDANAPMIYINAGNGGRDNVWHNIRLYNEVIQYNPDVVFLEYVANDQASRNINGEISAKAVTESTIRMLLGMEERPIICMLHQTQSEAVNLPLLAENGVYAFATTKDAELGTYNITEWSNKVKDSIDEVAEHYGIPIIDEGEWYAKYSTLNLDGKVKYFNRKYNLADTVVQLPDYTECNEGDWGATKAFVMEGKTLYADIDFAALAQSFGKDINDYSLNDSKTMIIDGTEYTCMERSLIDRGISIYDDVDLANTYLRVSYDSVHLGGYHWINNDADDFNGDMSAYIMTHEPGSALRCIEGELPAPLLTPTYDDMYLKLDRVRDAGNMEGLTVDTTAGGSYSFNSSFGNQYGRTRNGTTFVGPLTIEYKFSGKYFATESSLNTPAGQGGDGVTQLGATIDGIAMSLIDTKLDYVCGSPLGSGDHVFRVTIPEGYAVNIAGFYVQKDENLNDEKLGADGYVTIDIKDECNVIGALDETDGTAFCARSNTFYDYMGQEKYAGTFAPWYNRTSLAIQRANKPDILLDVEDDISSRDILPKGAFVNYMNNEYAGDVPYDISSINNSTRRAISTNRTLQNGNSPYSSPKDKIDFADGRYDKLYLLLLSKYDLSGDTAPAVVFNYADGTNAEVKFDVTKNSSVYRLEQMPETVFSGFAYNADTHQYITGNYTGVSEYEITNPNADKVLASVAFKKYDTQMMGSWIYAMTLHAVDNANIVNVTFENEDGRIYNVNKFVGQTVNVNYYIGSNLVTTPESRLFVAFYNADGALISSKFVDKDNIDSTEQYLNKITDTVTIPEGFSIIKAFIWNNSQDASMQPMAVSY